MKTLILADVHGNREALEAVLEDAEAVDDVWCLGDVVGYGPDPGGCIERIISLGPSVWLAGNHDLVVVGRLDPDEFNIVARAAIHWTAAELTSAESDVLDALSSRAEIRGVTVAHGSPLGPEWEYVDDVETAGRNLAALETDICFVGHTHVAAVSERLANGRVTHERWPIGQPMGSAQRRLILNPGSVGQPRDGDPRASYAVLDDSDRSVQAYRATYDIAAVQAKIRRAGLPTMLARRIAEGR